MRTTEKALKMVGMALLTISVLAMCWVFASFVDVTRNNMVPHPEYQSWNFFTLPKEVK